MQLQGSVPRQGGLEGRILPHAHKGWEMGGTAQAVQCSSPCVSASWAWLVLTSTATAAAYFLFIPDGYQEAGYVLCSQGLTPALR